MKTLKIILIVAFILLTILFPVHVLSWGIMLGITALLLGFGIVFLGLLFVQVKDFFSLFSSKENSNIKGCSSNIFSSISDDDALMAYYLLKEREKRNEKVITNLPQKEQ